MSYEVGTFFTEEKTKTYNVVEGNITVSSGLNVLNGQRVDILNFADEVSDETFLEFANEELAMQPAKAGSYATHMNAYEPEFPTGAIPKTAKTDGSYTRRFVGCTELEANKEYKMPLVPNNAQIKAGDNLECVSAKTGLDKKATGTTTVRALEDVPANAGQEYIFVVLSEPKIPIKASG